LLLKYSSFRLLIWVDAATALIYAGIIWRLIPETLPSRTHNAGAGASLAEPDISALEAASIILRDRVFVVFCLASLSVAMVYMQAMSTLPLYLKGQGFTPADYGQIIAVNGIMITLLQLPMVSLLHRFNRAWVIALASLVTGLGFVLTVVAVTKWHYMLTVVVWTLGEIMSAAFASAIIADLAPLRLRARYMGVFSVCFSSANMIGAPLGGTILERFGGNSVWAGSFVLAGLSCALYLSIRSHIAGQPAQKPTPAENAIAIVASAPPPTSSLSCGLNPADSTTALPASGTTPQ
jgi:MFS family permease